jgi:pimeloyl-ACP methyl ester carboxylesterase
MTGEPFTYHVPDDALADLRQRLARTRLPDQAPEAPWTYGTDVTYLADLLAYWRDRFDWRAQETALNAFPQARLRVGEIDLHYLHVPGQGPNPRPLLLCHGWPGSVFEFLDLIPRLTDPARFGGRPEDAFTVVAPSLPGYGLSFRPGQPRLGVEEIADHFAELMTRLGYERFMTQGGDWGAFITTRLAWRYPERVEGLHLNMLPVRRDLSGRDATPEEAAHYARVGTWLKEETGYQWIQGTKPQTLAFALTDSPSGLAAWIAEKFRSWSDCDGTIETAILRDRMLANISLYWFTGAIGSSFHPYYSRMHRPWPVPDGEKVRVPTAYAAFPKEMVRPPRSLAEATMFSDLRRWTELPRGGHFAALEQPDLLAEDVRAFARSLRD